MIKTERFMEVLLNNSESDDWTIAREEWIKDEIKFVNEGKCICGQKKIRKIVVIKNIKNNKKLEIGSNCWETVLGRESLNSEFKLLRNKYILQKYGIFNMPSLFTILYNFEKFIIDDWEFSFLISTNSMKHEFSSKQKEILKRLIDKLIPINDSKIKVNHIYYVYDGVTWCTITFNYNMNKEHTLRRKIKNKYLFDYSSSNQYDIIDKDLFEIGLR